MTRSHPEVAAPRLSDLDLPNLADADPAMISAHHHHEGVRYRDADLSGRDLSGVTFTECEFLGVRADETELRHARFHECRIERLDAPVVNAARATLRDVVVERSRLGAVELYDAELHSLALRSCKVSWLNLRSSDLRDVSVSDCAIEELELTGGQAERVRFENCTVGTLRLQHARLRDVDLRGLDLQILDGELRGAVVSAAQAIELVPLLARHLGLTIAD